jgi:5-formyltetrahydrofolate cyclo-ligase
VYLPIIRQHEVDTWKLVRWLWREHPRIAVYAPRVRGAEMEHVRITARTKFKPGAFSVLEPVAGGLLGDDERVNLVIVPLLAVDRCGYRVGYGSGFYDRFLAEQAGARRVGLAYDDCRLEGQIDCEDYDEPIDMVVTERGVYELST